MHKTAKKNSPFVNVLYALHLEVFSETVIRYMRENGIKDEFNVEEYGDVAGVYLIEGKVAEVEYEDYEDLQSLLNDKALENVDFEPIRGFEGESNNDVTHYRMYSCLKNLAESAYFQEFNPDYEIAIRSWKTWENIKVAEAFEDWINDEYVQDKDSMGDTHTFMIVYNPADKNHRYCVEQLKKEIVRSYN